MELSFFIKTSIGTKKLTIIQDYHGEQLTPPITKILKE
jgi:hypothetical protein